MGAPGCAPGVHSRSLGFCPFPIIGQVISRWLLCGRSPVVSLSLLWDPGVEARPFPRVRFRARKGRDARLVTVSLLGKAETGFSLAVHLLGTYISVENSRRQLLAAERRISFLHEGSCTLCFPFAVPVENCSWFFAVGGPSLLEYDFLRQAGGRTGGRGQAGLWAATAEPAGTDFLILLQCACPSASEVQLLLLPWEPFLAFSSAGF